MTNGQNLGHNHGHGNDHGNKRWQKVITIMLIDAHAAVTEPSQKR